MDCFDLRLWSDFNASGGDPALPAIIDQIVIDSRRISSPSALFVALKGEFFDGHSFVQDAQSRGARYALVKKNFTPANPFDDSLTLLRVDDPLRAFQEICKIYRSIKNIPILAITGSQGKTLLKDLLVVLLAGSKNVTASPESFNSQIGVPLSLLQISSKNDLAIIEVGISQKGEMDILTNIVSPTYAILTGIGHSHLATLDSVENIAFEKTKLLASIPENQWVISSSDPVLKSHFKSVKAQCYFWDNPDPSLPHVKVLATEPHRSISCLVEYRGYEAYPFTIPYDMPYLKELINMGIKAAWLLGLSAKEISEGLANFRPEPMQTELWTSPLGATFINDSYSADPTSVALALKNLHQAPPHGRKIFIFGGIRNVDMDSMPIYKQIADTIAEAKINQLFLVGSQSMAVLKKEIINRSPLTQVVECKNKSHALQEIRASLKKDDFILIQGPRKERLNDLVEELNDLVGDNRLTIHLSTIKANLEAIQRHISPDTRLMVMVKAQAYGTDHIILSRYLSRCNVDILGVAHVDEAISLRRAGITQKIFVINTALYEVQKLVNWEFEVGVSSESLIRTIDSEACKMHRKIQVHLHVDTGMSRFGCRPEETLALAQLIEQSPGLKLEGIMTHLACADIAEEDHFTMHQARIFKEIVALLESHGISPQWRHAANSSGTIRSLIPEGNMVRVGLSIFGLHPSPCTNDLIQLQPALTLTSRIAGINTCKQGETISYGRTYQVKRLEERIGVIPMGYFDGIHRHYSGKGYVLVHGQPAPLVGIICMDFFMVDLSDIPQAQVGDPVLIFGRDPFGHFISPEEFANRAGTNVHELITCLGPRIQRMFIQNEH
jgi:alanine racemase